MKRPVVLVVLDGWGYRAEQEGNAIAMAGTPTWDRLVARAPWTLLDASGLAVGLPRGQMGNSEVGHLNLGAGRVVMQDLPRINEPRTGLSMGQHCELMAQEWKIAREDQDKLAYESHVKAAAAYDSGFHADLLVPFAGLGGIEIFARANQGHGAWAGLFAMPAPAVLATESATQSATQSATAPATSPATAPAAPPVVTLCYERANVRPWRTEDGRGLNFELLKLVGRRENIRFDFQSMPWKRCLAQLKANAVDGAFAVSGLAHDVVPLLPQHLGEVEADQRLVLGDEHPTGCWGG